MRPLNVTALTVLIGCLLVQGRSALAQSMSGAPGKPNIIGSPQSKSQIPPPPAVPGAIARPGTVSPADRTAADLPPTEALFDAINRGDVITARDAVTRGADIDATNLVGLTPLELSVDLSRNDITFLLLSLRNGAAKPIQTQQSNLMLNKTLSRKAERHPHAVEPRQEVDAKVLAPVKRSAVSYTGNGGTAAPGVGFLGFNPGK